MSNLAIEWKNMKELVCYKHGTPPWRKDGDIMCCKITSEQGFS
jgi:uncharacterized Zn finger protein (UPF0148 family)